MVRITFPNMIIIKKFSGPASWNDLGIIQPVRPIEHMTKK
jgi:hypothetical protein